MGGEGGKALSTVLFRLEEDLFLLVNLYPAERSNLFSAQILTHPQRKQKLPQRQSPSRLVCENEKVIIVHAGKNLGPVGVSTNQYIRWALDNHLLHASTYLQISD